MHQRILCAAMTAIIAAGAVPQASAQEGRERHERGEHWRDRDIARFHEHDFDRWRRGHWERGRHEGRRGWWWVVDGVWFYYPAPVYPYPDPYQPPVIAGAPPPPPGSAPPPARVYYYCDNPPGYYPYVPACPTPWRAVPAGPG
jgi:hypothetical protein